MCWRASSCIVSGAIGVNQGARDPHSGLGPLWLRAGSGACQGRQRVVPCPRMWLYVVYALRTEARLATRGATGGNPMTPQTPSTPRGLAGDISIPFAECLVLDNPLGEARFLHFQQVGSGEAAEHIEQDGDDARPSRLVAGAEAGAVVSVEVFVEQNEIPPVRVVLELRGAAVDRTAAAPVPEKDGSEPPRDLVGDLEERHPLAGAGRAFDSELVAIKGIEVQEPADDENIDRHPHRPAPVRVPAEHPRVGLGRQVGHVMRLAGDVEDERVIPMVARERADAMGAQKLVLVEEIVEDPFEPALRDG